MASPGLRFAGILASAALAASLIAVVPSPALAKGGGDAYVCAGGSIPAGTYGSVTITGICTLDVGDVTVTGSLFVAPGGMLIAAFGGSDLTVGANVVVEEHGVLVLGCEPEAFICFNDPDQVTGTLSATGSIGGNLTAEKAWAVLVHDTSVEGNVVVDGGGGGLTCAPTPFGPPAYATFEDVTVGRNISISGWRSCWLGVIRTHVDGNVNFHDNIVADPDGNEVVTNVIGRNLTCSGNAPAPQVGDSQGSLNTVGGKATGQCTGLVH